MQSDPSLSPQLLLQPSQPLQPRPLPPPVSQQQQQQQQGILNQVPGLTLSDVPADLMQHILQRLKADEPTSIPRAASNQGTAQGGAGQCHARHCCGYCDHD
mmetsp:Transcript_3370/g.8390  ORF Transcript_3370/g.8390 Transcript_3370/m.8390 type:complete len:101 (+) Transcript_3370:159-461(+)